MFKRNKNKSFVRKIKNFIYPDAGIKRSLLYWLYRLLRLNASTHSVSLGFSLGILVSFGPIIIMHTIIVVILSLILRANTLSAIFGSLFGNPWTFPFLWYIEYHLGNLLFFSNEHTRIGFKAIIHLLLKLKEDSGGAIFWYSLFKLHLDYVGIRLRYMKHIFLNDIIPVLKPLIYGSMFFSVVCAIISYVIAYWVVSKLRRKYKR